MDNYQVEAGRRVYEFAETHGVDGKWAVERFLARGATPKAERVVMFRCSFGRYVSDATHPPLGWHDPHDLAAPGTSWHLVRTAYIESNGDEKRAKDRLRQQRHRTGTDSGAAGVALLWKASKKD